MRIRALTGIAFLALIRNKLIILFFAIFVCVVLLMMTPIAGYKAMAADNRAQGEAMIVLLISAILKMTSGFGSLLSAWAAADAVASEMKTGTVMAIMARPVRRWELLLAKYLGVQILMAIYVVLMFGMTNVLAWLGGERLVTDPWVLLVYPMVRYGIYSAAAIWLVAVMHPVFAFVIVMFGGTVAGMVSPSSMALAFLPDWLRSGLFVLLPSVDLLSEDGFLAITSATLHQTPWTEHLTRLAYGLDYALVCLLLAFWAFRRRNLARE
jgi:ABC-type transport system involved in multi-copper enzyme maturation permease subunit